MREASGGRAVAVCIDTRDGAGRKRLYGVARFARLRGWRMLLVRHGGREAAREVLALRPQGIIAYGAEAPLVAAAARLGVPLADTAQGDVAVPLLATLDSDAVGAMAAEHLAGIGVAHFGYCGVKGRAASDARRQALAAALTHRGRRLHAFAQAIAEGESRIEPLARWLRRLPKPVGLLTFDDKLGERVLTACRVAGLAVPDAVAVLGIGDDELMCELSAPSLSSISCPTERLGYEAAEMLDRAMRRRRLRPATRRLPPVGVIARGSTDTLAVDDRLVREAVYYCRGHASEAIGVKHVALALGVPRRTLDRRCVAAIGRTVHDELVAARMQLARRLLTDTDQAVAAVGQRCGYETGPSFSRAFRQHAGCWPNDYRRQVRVV